MIHNLGDAQELLRRARRAAVRERARGTAARVVQLKIASPRRKLSAIVTLNEQALPSAGVDGAGTEGTHIRRKIKRRARRDDRARSERVSNLPAQCPP